MNEARHYYEPGSLEDQLRQYWEHMPLPMTFEKDGQVVLQDGSPLQPEVAEILTRVREERAGKRLEARPNLGPNVIPFRRPKPKAEPPPPDGGPRPGGSGLRLVAAA